MVPVLSRVQIRAFDAHAMDLCHVPSLVLMENAGRAATDVLVRELLPEGPRGARVVVVAGAGNNGGDGFVVARHLLVRGAQAVVVLAGDPQRLSADAAVNLDAWRGVGGDVQIAGPAEGIGALAAALPGARVVVDALFGTGLDRPIDGFRADIVRAVNASGLPPFALDLPSGLDADTGAILGVAVEARATATFAHPKLGLLTPRGAVLAGRVHVVDIGVPASLVARVGHSASLLEPADLTRWTAARAPGVHKNSAGHVLVVGGSAGKVGAPQLAARGAMRAGAGLATIATWPEAAAAIESGLLEVMSARIDPARAEASFEVVAAGKDSVVIGPGLGLDEGARALVEHVVAAWKGPIVVDADALTLFAGRPAALAAATAAVLTPHPGELARLLGTTAADIEADRFAAARKATAATRSVVVLKGAHTIVASPDGRVAVSPVACPVLATAGSGDVLGGVIAAMVCALPPFEAACAGVLMHARAGEAWSREHGGADRGMLASEIADRLGAGIR